MPLHLELLPLGFAINTRDINLVNSNMLNQRLISLNLSTNVAALLIEAFNFTNPWLYFHQLIFIILTACSLIAP